MSTATNNVSNIEHSDAHLVMRSLGGDRDAFCDIVSRYQTLLCSLAYSAVGDIKHSEDIAQESFVQAWKKLDTLHDPAKLKAWLCGIVRFKVSRFFRREKNQPTQHAEALEEHPQQHPCSADLEQTAIDQQQHSLLWKTLDGIDEIYREPLILFYREQQSVKRVAQELDLAPDTVKQRLSRGRKLLSSAMTTLVETGLKDSKPSAAFTTSVMTVISSLAPPGQVTAFGAGASTGAVKVGLLNLTTFLALLASISGLVSSFFGLKASLDQSRTKRERQLAIKSATLFISFAIIFILGVFSLKYIALADSENASIYALISQLIVLAFVLSYVALVPRMFEAVRTLRAQERIFEPEAFTRAADQIGSKQREYRSKLSLLGAPLIHVQLGALEAGDKPAFGWLAAGSHAHGLIFAWGGIAVAPISVGIVSVGIITIGAVGFGIFSVGAVAIGIIGFGASAIGYKAYSSLSSLGWESAFSNGFSIANEAAIGYIAYADHVNDDVAAAIVDLSALSQSHEWVLAAVTALVIIPAFWYAKKVKQRMG